VGIAWQVGLVVVLVLVNAFLAGSEMALVSLREGQLRRLAATGGRGRAVAALAHDPNQFLATVQIGITLAGFLASATAAVTLAEPLVEPLAVLGRAARPVAIVVVTLVVALVTLVIGELAPKRLAMQRAEPWALMAARPLAAMAAVVRPAVWLLARSTDLVVALLGGDPTRGRAVVTEEEVRDLIAGGSLYTDEERRIITGALEATNRVLRQVMRPRSDVFALGDGVAVDDAVRALVDARHTRAPVFHQELDDADRTVALLDLIGADGTVDDHARPATVVPESLPLVGALRMLQAAASPMALVVSEHGGFEGIVTMEDLVEELVGEIDDEYDRDVQAVVRQPDGSLTVVGGFPIHDLVDVGVDLPAGEYVTVAGLVQDVLQRLARPGDEITVGDWRLRILSVRGRTVREVRLSREVVDGG